MRIKLPQVTWRGLMLIALLFAAPLGIGFYRASTAGFDLGRLAPNPAYRVQATIAFDSNAGEKQPVTETGDDAPKGESYSVRMFQPQNEAGLTLGNRWTDSDLSHNVESFRGGNRLVGWYGDYVGGRGHITTAFTTVAKKVRYVIDPKLATPDSLIDNDLPFLQGTELVPVGHPRIAELTDQIAPT